MSDIFRALDFIRRWFSPSPRTPEHAGIPARISKVTKTDDDWLDFGVPLYLPAFLHVGRWRRIREAEAGTANMREIVHLQAGQCGNQIGAKVRLSTDR